MMNMNLLIIKTNLEKTSKYFKKHLDTSSEKFEENKIS